MTLQVHPIEALWFVVNVTTLLLTLLALLEARRDLVIAEADTTPSHEARELTARGNVRREFLRVIIQALLISIVIPGLFTDRPISLSPIVLALIGIAIVLLASTIFDTRERTKLGQMLLELVKADRDLLALEASVQTNIELTREGIHHAQIAGEKADAAFSEANHANVKLATLTELVNHKEDKPPAEGEDEP